MIIQSFQNPKIKHVTQLQNKKYRELHQEFIAQGFKTCHTLLQAGYQLKTIFFTQEMYHIHQNDFLTLDTYVVHNNVMKHISTLTKPSGIVAIFEVPKKPLIISKNAIILYGIQDPGNLGTLIRTASALNISCVYLVDSVDFFNPKVIQATTGCLQDINIYETSWQNLKELISSIPTCALVVKSGKLPHQVPLKDAIIIIGNEGQGLPQEIIQQCTYQVTLPISGHIDSLNAAVAGAIAMYLKSQS